MSSAPRPRGPTGLPPAPCRATPRARPARDLRVDRTPLGDARLLLWDTRARAAQPHAGAPAEGARYAVGAPRCGDMGGWRPPPADHPAWGTTRRAGATSLTDDVGALVPAHPPRWHRTVSGRRHRGRLRAVVDTRRARYDDRARTRPPGRTSAPARHRVVWDTRSADRGGRDPPSAPTTRR